MLLNACKDIGLAVNTGKTKYMKMGCHQGIIAKEHIRIGSNSFEKGTLMTNQNSVQEETKWKLKAGNSYYYSVQTPLSSQILGIWILPQK